MTKHSYAVYNSVGQFFARFTSYSNALRWAMRNGMERDNKKRKGKHKMKNEISSALFDMYDIRKALSKGIRNKPKDSEDTDTTIGDCIDSVIETLERLEEVTP